MTKTDIGNALDSIDDDVKRFVSRLTAEYRSHGVAGVLKQAVDTPHRVRTQLTAWIASYDTRHGAGTGQTFLASCLTAAGSARTLAQLNAALANLETAAQALVTHVQNGWTWDQVATAIEQQMQPTALEAFQLEQLPIPNGYVTVWGEPW